MRDHIRSVFREKEKEREKGKKNIDSCIEVAEEILKCRSAVNRVEASEVSSRRQIADDSPPSSCISGFRAPRDLYTTDRSTENIGWC